jgi:hypothetical protein
MKLHLIQSLIGPIISMRDVVDSFFRGLLLAEYSLAFSQLDYVWTDLDPLFLQSEVVPAKPTQFSIESIVFNYSYLF